MNRKFVAGVAGKGPYDWIVTYSNGKLFNTLHHFGICIWAKVEFDTAEELALYLLSFPEMTQY